AWSRSTTREGDASRVPFFVLARCIPLYFFRHGPHCRRSFQYQLVEALAAGRDHPEKLPAHARLPEFVDVFRHSRDALFMRFRPEKGRDLIGLTDHFLRRHLYLLPTGCDLGE